MFPKNDDHFAVGVKLKAGAPTVQATIASLQCVFIVDTGSSISLIQQGVCSSKVRTTDLLPFGVRGKEREIRGTQDGKFCLNNRKFIISFVCSLPTDADGIIVVDFLSKEMRART
jgi:hypothetical protein